MNRATGQTEEYERILEEISDQLQSGQLIDIEQYLNRYPEHAEQLARLLPSMQALSQLSQQSDSKPPGSDFLPPVSKLGDFRIVREIARGGMGIVYEAEQISLERRVAIKVLPFAGMLGSHQLQRFKNEAQAAATLQHPNIVNAFFFGQERGIHFYAMQLIEGQSLSDLIGHWNEERPDTGDLETQPNAFLSTEISGCRRSFHDSVARLGVQAAEALSYAHSTGIIHRDIKPSNLLIDRDGRVWITDFGLASIQSDATITMSGDLLGTLRYMSPEQARGNNSIVDARSDIYSLGITLYEMLARIPAFEDTDRHRLLKRILDDGPRPLRSLDSSIPTDLETIILQATAREPADRYGAMDQLCQDLQSFLVRRPIVAKRKNMLQRSSRWLARHHFAMVMIACIGLVCSLLFGWGWRREAYLRSVADDERIRAEAYSKLADDVTLRGLDAFGQYPITQHPSALHRLVLTEAIKAHRAVDSDYLQPFTLASLLIRRAENSFQGGRPIVDDANEAIALLELVDVREQDAAYRKVLASAWEARGLALNFELAFSGAIEAFSCAKSFADLPKKRGWINASLAGTLVRAGRPEHAVKIATNYQSMKGALGTALNNKLNFARARLMQLEEANRDITETIRTASRSSRPLDEFWYASALNAGATIATQCGDSELGAQRAEAAITAFSRLLERYPEIIWAKWSIAKAYSYLAEAALIQRNLQDAERALRAGPAHTKCILL